MTRGVALALYAFATITLGFGHHPPSISIDLAQFMLPDGTIAPICGSKKSGEQGGDSLHHAPCDACCLTHAPGLPPQTAVDDASGPTVATAELAFSRDLPHPRTTVAAHGPRGPPLG